MIIFDLSCRNDHRFEGWFGSADDFEDQLAAGMITCPSCGAHEIRRVPSAVHIGPARSPRVPSAVEAGAKPVAAKKPPQPLAIYDEMARALLSASEDVGSAFAEEARRIHYLEAPARSIHGQSSDEEFEALRDEGIDVWRLPTLKSN